MTGITLPYTLQDGQKAYAARLMANLNALAAKLNSVNVPGLPAADVESALQQLKLLLDEEYAADAKVVSSLEYLPQTHQLQLTLNDGASFVVDMSPFLREFHGADTASCSVAIDGQGGITAALKPGAVTNQTLAADVQASLAAKVPASQRGNAAQILFADGDSFQAKLERGDLKGADGIAALAEGMYYLRVGDDGHLYLGFNQGDTPPPLSINGDGHLVYAIE